MKILSLDSSFSKVNVSVVEDGRITFLHYERLDRKFLEVMPGLLKSYGIHPADFEGFAVSVGVGYSTSLRAGITLVKTWAYLHKKPIVAYENLHMMLLYGGCSLPRSALLKVGTKVFYRRLDTDGLSPVKVFTGNPEGECLCLKEQMECSKALDFFPFSSYGGLWAYERLTKGYKGDDVMKVDPVYVS